MERTCKYTTGHIFLAALGGTLVGAITAFLVAPKSGSETRGEVVKYFNNAKDTVSRVPEALRNASYAAKEVLSEHKA